MTTVWTMLIVITNLSGGIAVIPGNSYETKDGCEKELFDPIYRPGISVVSGACVPYDPSAGGVE